MLICTESSQPYSPVTEREVDMSRSFSTNYMFTDKIPGLHGRPMVLTQPCVKTALIRSPNEPARSLPPPIPPTSALIPTDIFTRAPPVIHIYAKWSHQINDRIT